VSGAFDAAGELVGASVGFAAVAEEPELHSHITGVATSHRRSGVGLVLKLHQRWWALERGIETITWTFDPLIKRNANFNLARLGATAGQYLENVYGDMNDVLNGRDESDRLWVRWHLSDVDVEAAAAGTPRRVPAPVEAVKRLTAGRDGRPAVLPTTDAGESLFTCEIPTDIELLRRSDPELASAWRLALRAVLGRSLRAGGRILGLNDAGDYVVAKPAGTP
jgi:predicted GNAT superfamily acetyltransferase